MPKHYIQSGEGKQQKKGQHIYNCIAIFMGLLGAYKINMHLKMKNDSSVG